MKIFCLFFYLFLNVIVAFSQLDSTPVYPNFKFNDGIYLTFEEFKKNTPTYTDFEISYRGGNTKLTVAEAVESKTKEIHNPWGYCINSNVYINQGFGNKYYKLQIIGALIHYFSIEVDYRYRDFYDPYDPFYSPLSYRQISVKEKLLEWNTGKSFDFNYKNFKLFLEKADKELLNQLETSKKKRKMIYYFMMQYNAKHKVFIEN